MEHGAVSALRAGPPRRRPLRAVAAFALTLFTVLGFATVGAAQAHGRIHVSFLISPNQQAGSDLHFTYNVRGTTKKDTVVFQRQNQPGNWATIEKLSRRGHNGTAPAMSIDEYVVRVAVRKSHRLQAAATGRTIFVYGQVPFNVLCNAGNVVWGNNDEGCNSSTVQLGEFLFSSEATFQAPGTANNTPATTNLTISPTTSCTSMHLDYGESNNDQEHAGGDMMITQTVLQENTAPVVSTFPGGTAEHIDIKLDGGPVEITDTSSTAGDQTLNVLENGYLNCYTPDGVVPGT